MTGEVARAVVELAEGCTGAVAVAEVVARAAGELAVCTVGMSVADEDVAEGEAARAVGALAEVTARAAVNEEMALAVEALAGW